MKKALIYFVAVLVLAGCGQQAKTPAGVAERFWDAMVVDDLETAKSLAVAGSMDDVTLDGGGSKPGTREYGIAEINDAIAIVPTWFANMDDGDVPEINFTTTLRREGEEWKVDFNATTASMFGASLKKMSEAPSEAVGDAIKEGAEEIGKALSEGMQESGKAVEETAKDIEETYKK